jgi:hypothetical protein
MNTCTTTAKEARAEAARAARQALGPRVSAACLELTGSQRECRLCLFVCIISQLSDLASSLFDLYERQRRQLGFFERWWIRRLCVDERWWRFEGFRQWQRRWFDVERRWLVHGQRWHSSPYEYVLSSECVSFSPLAFSSSQSTF